MEVIWPTSCGHCAVSIKATERGVRKSVILEIFSDLVRFQTRDLKTRPPYWLRQVEKLLNARFNESLSVTEIANFVDVHPVHLARAFRKYHYCTIGEYIRRLRVNFSCCRLSTSNSSIAEIALAAGFSDQAHLSRTFKSITGLTPFEFRKKYRLCLTGSKTLH